VSQELAVGAEAPNFDLTSTEDVVLMLCDEVPRMAVVLFFFADPASERTRAELVALAEAQHRLAANRAVILGVSRAKMPELKKTQQELDLRFPLLEDDRDFSSRYGVVEATEGGSISALFLVDRDQKIVWLERPLMDMAAALGQIQSVLDRQPLQTYHYPGRVVNRVVDWWVNRVRPRPAS